MKVLSRVSLLCVLVFGLGCSEAGPSPLTEADKEAIRAHSAKWMSAAAQGDWDTLLETYTDDAILWFNGNVIEGRDELEAFFSVLPPMQGMELIIDEIYGRGDLAVVSGHSLQVVDGETIVGGRYLDTRLRQPDGTWLFHRDHVSQFLAPPYSTAPKNVEE